ncbi:MAG: hypothetical protein R6T96_16035, partial [Longimicrobiales bacterium]
NINPTPRPTATAMPEKKICGKRVIAYYPYWTSYRPGRLPYLCHGSQGASWDEAESSDPIGPVAEERQIFEEGWP